MRDIIDDLFKIYISLIDGNNARIYQTINDKYTTIDKAMLTAYLYINAIIDLQITDAVAKDKIINYILRKCVSDEMIYGEVIEEIRQDTYNKIFNNVAKEKIKEKNKLLKQLKYKYKYDEKENDYDNLILFFEDLADLFIMLDLYSEGNKEAFNMIPTIVTKIDFKWMNTVNFESKNINNEVVDIILGIKETEDLSDKQYKVSNYYELSKIVFNLRKISVYPKRSFIVDENLLFHTYALTIINIIMCNYLSEKNENISKYEVIFKSLFCKFTHFMGKDIEKINNSDELIEIIEEQDSECAELLSNSISEVIFGMATQFNDEEEGYVVEVFDKLMFLMKIWIEIEYFNNITLAKAMKEITDTNFKKLYGEIDRTKNIKDKIFFKNLILQMYVYVKRNILRLDENILLRYFTDEEIIKANDEIEELERKVF